MKLNIRKLVIVLLVHCSAIACNESDFSDSEVAGTCGRYLKATVTSLSLESSAGSSADTEIKCLKNAWKISNLPSWISSSPQQGHDNTIVTITATEDNNSADDLRTCLFKIESAETDWNYSIPISATQSRAIPSIQCEPEYELSFNYESKTKEIIIKANCSWDYYVEDESWLKCTKLDNGNINVSVAENTTNSSRVNYIYIKSNNYNLTRTIRVIQNISEITTTTNNIDVGSHGGDYSLNIISETPWTATCAQSWINISPQNGEAGTTEVNISVSPNKLDYERTAHIHIIVGDNQRIDIPIIQDRSYVRPLRSSITIPSRGGAIDITILANDSWSIDSTTIASWLSFTNMSGDEKGETKLTATDNSSANSRTAEVVFSTSLEVEYKLPITQEGRYLIISPQTVYISKEGGDSEPIEIDTDGIFAIETSDSWLTSRNSAVDSRIFITASRNENDSSREGYVYLYLTDLTDGTEVRKCIRVYQIGNASSSFFINSFSDEDKDWNFYNDANINITIKGFSTSENNWNPK